MKYTEKPEKYTSEYGQLHFCDHPVYTRCTLYIKQEKGIAVIQQYYNSRNKTTYWKEIEPWLTDMIYLAPGFSLFFEKKAKSSINGLFPTVTVRHAMRELGLNPLRREPWETYFDRKDI